MRKSAAILLTLCTVFLFAGCFQDPRDSPNVRVSADGEWYEEYVKVSSGEVVLCLWNRSGTQSDYTMDCDWENPNPFDMPENVTPTDITQDDSWSEEKVNVSSGETIFCLWKNRDFRSAVRSCDWST